MMESVFTKVRCVSVRFGIFRHSSYRGRLVIVGADVHTLNAQTFLLGEELHQGAVQLLFAGCLLYSPVKLSFGYEVWQTDHRDPAEVLLAGVVHATDTFLPPQTLQRRHHIVEVTIHLVAPHLAHFDGVGHRLQKADSLFVGTVFLVGIAVPAHCQKVHGWHRDDIRRFGRQIEFLVFFLIVECHIHFLRFWDAALRSAS